MTPNRLLVFMGGVIALLGVAFSALALAAPASALTYDECRRLGGTELSCAYLKPPATSTPYTVTPVATATATPRYPDCYYRGECPGATPYTQQATVTTMTPAATATATPRYPDCYYRGECPGATPTTYSSTTRRVTPVPAAPTTSIADCVARGDCP